MVGTRTNPTSQPEECREDSDRVHRRSAVIYVYKGKYEASSALIPRHHAKRRLQICRVTYVYFDIGPTLILSIVHEVTKSRFIAVAI